MVVRLRSTGGSSLQSLIQRFQGQGTSTFGFLAFAVVGVESARAVAVEDGGEAGLPSGKHLLVPRGNILLREGGADFERDEDVVDLVGHGGDRRLEDVREETGKGKGFTGITLHAESIGGGAGEIGLAFVEAQIGPANEETQPGENGGGFGAQDDATEGIQQEEDGGEVFDAHLHETLEDGDGVFGHELFEGDEEGGLDGDATAYLGRPFGTLLAGFVFWRIQTVETLNTPYGRSPPDGSPEEIEGHDGHIGQESDGEDELGKLARTPGAFEILAAVEERGQVEEDGEDVLLNKGGGQQGPGIEEEA